MSEEGLSLDGFECDMPDTEETGDNKYTLLPEDLYTVKVREVRPRKHERGPMYGLWLQVVGDSPFVNRTIWTNIIFLPYYIKHDGKLEKDKDGKPKVTPGAGIARLFLKAIGQEYKGENLKVTPREWKDKVLVVKVKIKAGRNDIATFIPESEAQAPKKAVPAGNEEEIF